MTHPMLGAAALLLVAACSNFAAPVGDEKSVEAVLAEGHTLELSGGLVFEGLTSVVIAHRERLEGQCERSDAMWVEVADSDRLPSLQFDIPFEGTASGDHTVGTSYASRRGDDESESGMSTVSVGYSTAERVYAARAGTITPTIEPRAGSANLQVRGLAFEGYDAEGVTHEGSVALDLLVGCQTVFVEASGTCVWASETIPFTSEFCTTAMAGYSEDVWWGPAQDTTQD